MMIRERYGCGIEVAPEGGGLVIVEKRPRPTGRVERGLATYEDVFAIVHAERLAGRMIDMLDRVAAVLDADPLYGDSISFVETSLLGNTLPCMLAERGVAVGGVSISGDVETYDQAAGEWVVSPNVLQARIRLAFETARLDVEDELAEGRAILRALENIAALPMSGPIRDLTRAAALGFWAAERRPTNGPWASSKDPPPGPAAQYFEELDALRQVAREERESKRRGARWRAAFDRKALDR